MNSTALLSTMTMRPHLFIFQFTSREIQQKNIIFKHIFLSFLPHTLTFSLFMMCTWFPIGGWCWLVAWRSQQWIMCICTRQIIQIENLVSSVQHRKKTIEGKKYMIKFLVNIDGKSRTRPKLFLSLRMLIELVIVVVARNEWPNITPIFTVHSTWISIKNWLIFNLHSN